MKKWILSDFDIGKPLGKGGLELFDVDLGVDSTCSYFHGSQWFPISGNFNSLCFFLSGKFGNVYLAREKNSKYIVALKVCELRQLNFTSRGNSLKSLFHANCLVVLNTLLKGFI